MALRETKVIGNPFLFFLDVKLTRVDFDGIYFLLVGWVCCRG
jgi:hypothetical protein